MTMAWRNIDIRIYAVAISLLLSWWHSFVNPLLNPDAYTYIHTAEIFLDQGLAAAFEWYPNASYPVLIGLVNKITGIDLFSSAQILNAIFYALLSFSFITLVGEIYDDKKLYLYAAILILVFPDLNEYRFFLIRDIASLSLLFTAFFLLIRCYKNFSIALILYSSALCVLAALFRSEALIYLASSPFIFLLNSRKSTKERLSNFLQSVGVFAGAGITSIILLEIMGYSLIGSIRDIATIYAPFVDQIAASFDANNQELTTAVFGEYGANYSAEYIGLFMFAGLMAIVVTKTLAGLGPISVITFALAYFKRLFILPNNIRPIFYFSCVSFVITLGFILFTRFLSGRYLLPLCLLLLLLLPPAIAGLWKKASGAEGSRTLLFTLVFLGLYASIDSHWELGDSDASAKSVVAWIENNVSPNGPLLINDEYVAYHSKMVQDYDRVSRYITSSDIDSHPDNTIFVLQNYGRLESHIAPSLSKGNLELITQFPNSGEADYLIYKKR
ncbi:MAG: hypothetical protein R3332_06525 [Pseudohongiellaceae bacterium]|nr:hypothetical protein [Pseudohongiellaceae bacterium]